MNGIHDLGGMQDLGHIPYARTEPVFHERWEGRIFALNRCAGAWRKWNLDASRFQRELIPPAEYLRMSYYERWVEGLVALLLKTGLLAREELASGRPSPGTSKVEPLLTPDKVWPFIAPVSYTHLDVYKRQALRRYANQWWSRRHPSAPLTCLRQELTDGGPKRTASGRRRSKNQSSSLSSVGAGIRAARTDRTWWSGMCVSGSPEFSWW